MIGKVRDSKDENFGFNAETDEYDDLVKAGRHRPGQGHPPGPAERRVHRRPDAHHRSPGRRNQGRRQEGCSGGGGPGGQAAWAACTKLFQLAQKPQSKKGRPFTRPPFCFRNGAKYSVEAVSTRRQLCAKLSPGNALKRPEPAQ